MILKLFSFCAVVQLVVSQVSLQSQLINLPIIILVYTHVNVKRFRILSLMAQKSCSLKCWPPDKIQNTMNIKQKRKSSVFKLILYNRPKNRNQFDRKQNYDSFISCLHSNENFYSAEFDSSDERFKEFIAF